MRCAIVDIGYNAIRTVVYSSNKLGAHEIFNKKFKNDLLGLLTIDNLEVKHQTYLLLEYLQNIFANMQVEQVTYVATAVLRGHPRSLEFKEIVKKKYNIDIDIISGEKESYLSATAILYSIKNPNGIVVDLGGGSLEIAIIENNKIINCKSLPFGTKVIQSNNQQDIIHQVSSCLSDIFSNIQRENLYFIGGAFRLIARLYIEFTRYPLKNLHTLEISINDFESYISKIIYQTDHIIINQKYIDKKAIYIAQGIIKAFNIQNIIISNYGLKEGVYFLSLPEEERQKDIVYERVKKWVNFDDNLCNLNDYIAVIYNLLLTPDKTTIEVLKLAIILAHFNKNIDRNLISNFIIESILDSDIPFSHRERVMLSVILSVSYSNKLSYIHKIAKCIINKHDYSNSVIIGNFIKIAKELDGYEFIKPSFSFSLKGKYIEIITPNTLPRMVFAQICEYLKEIAYLRKSERYKSENNQKPLHLF